MLTLSDPRGLKNTTNVYSIHLELRMALPCRISTEKWKNVNLCLDFLGIPDQRAAYVKRQARPRWTYVRRSSVTPDLSIGSDNGLSPVRRQNIIWTNFVLMSIKPLGMIFSQILYKIQTLSSNKMHLTISSGKILPFCLGLNVLLGQTLCYDEDSDELIRLPPRCIHYAPRAMTYPHDLMIHGNSNAVHGY